jgi:hypothetical protein
MGSFIGLIQVERFRVQRSGLKNAGIKIRNPYQPGCGSPAVDAAKINTPGSDSKRRTSAGC